VSTTHQNGGDVMMFMTTEELEKRTEPGRAQMPAQIYSDLGEGKPGHTALLYNGRTPAERWYCERLVLASIGPAADVTEDILRSATHACVTALRGCGGVSSGIIRPPVLETTWDADEGVSVPSGCDIPFPRCVEIVTQTALLSNYAFDSYLTSPVNERKAAPLGELQVHISEELHSAEVAEGYERGLAAADATRYARDLNNERPDAMNPRRVEEICRALVDEFSSDSGSAAELSVSVIGGEGDETALVDNGLRMLSAVGQGATTPPRLVVLEYRGAGADSEEEDLVALVGKGVTFDTGGLNLKPTGFIENMHMDMGGAAAVIGCMRGCMSLQLKVNVVAVIALAENAIGKEAMYPHQILTSHAGKTVEVGNTDAEGRLCLADAMSWVQQQPQQPSVVIDVATLTGACVVALGEYAAGLFSNSDSLVASLSKAAKSSSEPVWHMPVLAQHTAELKDSQYADLRSIGKGREGGACTAAAFLQEFVVAKQDDKEGEEDGESSSSSSSSASTDWAHLDIAGPAMTSRPYGHHGTGGTGFGAALLLEWLAQRQQELEQPERE
jgi:leucyl aminopeptidase